VPFVVKEYLKRLILLDEIVRNHFNYQHNAIKSQKNDITFSNIRDTIVYRYIMQKKIHIYFLEEWYIICSNVVAHGQE